MGVTDETSGDGKRLAASMITGPEEERDWPEQIAIAAVREAERLLAPTGGRA